MRWNEYALVDRAVEEGIQMGWQHAHKHTDAPLIEDVQEALREAVMLALSEILTFELGVVEDA